MSGLTEKTEFLERRLYLLSRRLAGMRRCHVASLFVLAGFCLVYAQLARSGARRVSFRRLNIVYHAEAVRRHYFGLHRRRLSLDERRLEALWEQRAGLATCNRLAAIANASPVSAMPTRYRYSGARGFSLHRLPEAAEAAESAVWWRLRRAGHAPTLGGWSEPGACRWRETVAVVVPYRDRHENLVNFLAYMHVFLQRQRRRYVVVVAEQSNTAARFNRAKLFNAAVREIRRGLAEVECVVFHDVDKLPQHLFNLYACGQQPRQLATMAWNVTGQQWRDYYEYFFGGATAFSRWQLLRMNGMSNVFYGWGGEDDDMLGRTLLAGYLPSFPSKYVGRMWVMDHHHDLQFIPNLVPMLRMDKVLRRMRMDGLHEAKYTLKYRVDRPLYTVLGLHV